MTGTNGTQQLVADPNAIAAPTAEDVQRVIGAWVGTLHKGVPPTRLLVRLADGQTVELPIPGATMNTSETRQTGGGLLLLCAREVGELLGIDEVTVHRWNAADRLPAPALKKRGCTRWSRRDIELWVDVGCPGRREFEARKKLKTSR